RDERPALVATLHESAKRYDPARVPSFGQTLVYGVEPVPPLVSAVVDRMNRSASAEERWAPLYYPVATSSTEVIVDALGPQNTVGVCVETWSGFDEARRVAMHKEIVLHLLVGIGVLAPAGRDTDPPEASR
ncbi:MAG: hypothetical protein ABMB14_18835, partial [Myxococcota bacterium]